MFCFEYMNVNICISESKHTSYVRASSHVRIARTIQKYCALPLVWNRPKVLEIPGLGQCQNIVNVGGNPSS